MTPPDANNNSPLPSTPTPDRPAGGAEGRADAASVLAIQTRMAAGLAAASQKLIKGAREISMQHFMLQTALMRQLTSGWAGLVNFGSPDDVADARSRQANAVTEATLESMRQIMTAACKCSIDAFGAFHEHLGTGARVDAQSCGEHAKPAGEAKDKRHS